MNHNNDIVEANFLFKDINKQAQQRFWLWNTNRLPKSDRSSVDQSNT